MSVSLIESNLLFKFGNGWTNVFHWDRHADFLNGMKKAHKGKAVDFVGVYDNRISFLFEIKDYRTTSRNPDKMKIENEFELKVRSTVAALFGVRFDGADDSSSSFENLRHSRRPRVVLWHEDLVSSPSVFGILKDTITQRLSWLHPETLVTNSRFTSDIPELTVHPLPPARQNRIDEIQEILKRRFRSVPEGVKWKIDQVLEVSELDRLVERAKTVRTCWNLQF